MTYSRPALISGIALICGLGIAGCQQPAGNQSSGTASSGAVTAGQPAVNKDQAYASLGGEYLHSKLLDRYALERTNGMAMDELQANDIRLIATELTNLELLARAALLNGQDQDPDVHYNIALQRTKILARAQLTAWLDANPPSEDELKAMYEASLPELEKTLYKASHILIDDESFARELILKLDNGVDFAVLAQEHSSDSNANNGGDLGWFLPEQMVTPFADAVKSLKEGAYTAEPVKTQFGWHVVKLHGIRQEQAPPFDAQRNELEMAYRESAVDRYLNQLRSQTEVEMLLDEETSSGIAPISSDTPATTAE